MPESGEERDGFGPGDPFWEEAEMLREAQRLYVERTFSWLIEYITSYFPEDRLAVEDVVNDVHFIHTVVSDGKVAGVLVYRFRKARDKKAYFEEMASEIREETQGAEVLFVDTETSRFEAPASLSGDDPFVEIPSEGLLRRIRELREGLKGRARMRSLRENL